MFFNLLSHPEIGLYISLFITACFVIAFVFSYKNCRVNPSVFITSAVLFINFVIANNALYAFIENPEPNIENYYINWVGYNALSIIAIIVTHLVMRTKHHVVSLVSMYLLLINVIMYLSMHIDIIINGNREPWLLWQLYTPVVNVSEIGLAAILIIYSHNCLINKKHEPTAQKGI
jgi:hypothetical protein